MKQIKQYIRNSTHYLVTWIFLDAFYLPALLLLTPWTAGLSAAEFFMAHGFAIAVGSIVMFTGVGGGMLWIPLLTLLEVKPSEAIFISIFTQLAGKGMVSVTYLLKGLVDVRVARCFVPYALFGTLVGYVSGFFISAKYERILIYVFVLAATCLLLRMLHSLYHDPLERDKVFDVDAMKNSRLIVIISSFFTGLLSIGNSDWLVPHMERKLKMQTVSAVATGLFVMFTTLVFFLVLTAGSIGLGLRDWPATTPLLFATCSGVMLGGQIGTRLIRFQWLRERQKHAFILVLALSIIHLLW
jgi:hypothetical protein